MIFLSSSSGLSPANDSGAKKKKKKPKRKKEKGGDQPEQAQDQAVKVSPNPSCSHSPNPSCSHRPVLSLCLGQGKSLPGVVLGS